MGDASRGAGWVDRQRPRRRVLPRRHLWRRSSLLAGPEARHHLRLDMGNHAPVNFPNEPSGRRRPTEIMQKRPELFMRGEEEEDVCGAEGLESKTTGCNQRGGNKR